MGGDATESDRKHLAAVAKSMHIDGLVLSGSTVTRPGLLSFHYLSRQYGLLSGEPVKVCIML